MMVTAMAERWRRAGADADGGRDQPGDDREGGHQDRAAGGRGWPPESPRRSGTPCCAQPVHVVDLQNAVLLHDAEQQQDAQSAEQVQRAAGRDQRKQRERNRERQRQHG